MTFFRGLLSALGRARKQANCQAGVVRGVRAMREAMTKANLEPPTFESDREKDTFIVTFLFHHFLNPDDIRWLSRFSNLYLPEDEQKALIYAREMGAINNSAYRDINQMETLIASGHLRHLRDLGLLEQKGKSTATYYVPTKELLMGSEISGSRGAMETGLPTELLRQPQGLTPVLSDKPTGLGSNLQGLPTELAQKIGHLGRRAGPGELKALIAELCRWRAFSSEELAAVLGRNQHYILTSLIRPMTREGTLNYLYPDNPAHPQQAYTAGESKNSRE